MKSRKPSIPYIIWMVIFTMIPIIMIGCTAFTDKNGSFSLEPFANAVQPIIIIGIIVNITIQMI